MQMNPPLIYTPNTASPFNFPEFLTSFVQSNLYLDTGDKLFTTTLSYTTGRTR